MISFRHNTSLFSARLPQRPLSTLLGVDREDRRSEPPKRPAITRPTRWQIITGEADAPRMCKVYPYNVCDVFLTPVAGRPIKVYPPSPSIRTTCKDPIGALTRTQLGTLDPSGARTRLFAKSNPEAAKVGDVLLVRQKNGDPFAGACINIRRRGVDTAILLRNNLTRVGVEMWYKIYSPNVEGIEVVQRRIKRARRARLYYMRQPKHDMGSVQNIVAQYLQQRQALRSGDARGRDANSGKRKHAKSK